MANFWVLKRISDKKRQVFEKNIGESYKHIEVSLDTHIYHSLDAGNTQNNIENSTYLLSFVGEIWSTENPNTNISKAQILEEVTSARFSFTGNFALLILNKVTKSICIVTDKYNSFPVFVYKNDQELVLGTEYEPIVYSMDRPLLNNTSIAEYFLYDIVSNGNTLLQNLNYLPRHSISTIDEEVESVALQTTPLKRINNITAKGIAIKIIQILQTTVNRIFDKYDKKDVYLTLSGGLDSRLLLNIIKSDELKHVYALTFYTKNLDPDQDTDVLIARMLSKKLGFKHETLAIDSFQKSLTEDFFISRQKTDYIKKILLVGTYGGELYTGAYRKVINSNLNKLFEKLQKWKYRWFNTLLLKKEKELISQYFTDEFCRHLKLSPTLKIKQRFQSTKSPNKELDFYIEFLTTSFFTNIYEGSVGYWVHPFKGQKNKLTPFIDPELLDYLNTLPTEFINDPNFRIYHELYKILNKTNQIPTNNKLYSSLPESLIKEIDSGQQPKDYRVKFKPNLDDSLANINLLVSNKIIRKGYYEEVLKRNDKKELSKLIDLANWIKTFKILNS